MGTGKVYFLFVNFHFRGTTKNFEKYSYTLPGGNELGHYSLVSFKETGNYFNVVSYFVGLVRYVDDAIRGKQSKLDHYLRGYMNGHALTSYNVGHSPSKMNISKVYNRIETGKEITGE